jgi:hypothetical protein
MEAPTAYRSRGLAVPVFRTRRTLLGSLRSAVRFLATPHWSVAWSGVLLNDANYIIQSER